MSCASVSEYKQMVEDTPNTWLSSSLQQLGEIDAVFSDLIQNLTQTRCQGPRGLGGFLGDAQCLPLHWRERFGRLSAQLSRRTRQHTRIRRSTSSATMIPIATSLGYAEKRGGHGWPFGCNCPPRVSASVPSRIMNIWNHTAQETR